MHGPSAYASASDVAALTRRFTDNGAYTTATVPTRAQVENWINAVSSTLNVLLAEQGFATPVTQYDVALMLQNFVVTQVSDLCNYANSMGRFFSEKGAKTGPWEAIQKDAAEFIEKHAEGIQAIGATRKSGSGLSALDYNGTDGDGQQIEPTFSLKQFGNTNTAWDADR